ncbi:MAG: IS1634 family transposase, partial [Opitutaceae bacterium]
ILTELRTAGSAVRYLVGTPKGRLTRYEAALAERPWQEVREGLRVKLLPENGEVHVLAESQARAGKERGMRRARKQRAGTGESAKTRDAHESLGRPARAQS